MKIPSVFPFAAFLAIVLSATAHTSPISGVPTVVDGDTLHFEQVTVRMYGIDAAEAGQTCAAPSGRRWRCADVAMDRLVKLVASGITCEGDEFDAYGRILAVCYDHEGTDINLTLVAEGLAWAFRRYSDTYSEAENAARRERVGIWQAETETPWDYRAARWRLAEQDAPNGCPIKGNINKDGERIYHAPWSPWYTRTRVNSAAGERWFCNEREALEAGWRAPVWR